MVMRIKFFFYLALAIALVLPLKVEAKDIVCNPPKFSNRLNAVSNLAYGDLNRQKWQILVIENKNTKTNTFDNVKNGLSLYETQQILGFYGHRNKVACNGKAEHWVWIDQEDRKKTVQIIFFDNKINILKGKGF